VYSHEPGMDDEIEVHVDDVLSVEHVFADGWCYGKIMGSNKGGVFPGTVFDEE